MQVLALDIGGTKIATALVNNGMVTCRRQIATPTQNVVDEMHKVLAEIVQQYQGQFDCVAVASTGIINNGIKT